MTKTENGSIIHRKARVARAGFDARAMSPSKALRLALAKSADALFDLAVSVTTVEQTVIAQTAISKKMGDEGLLILLDGADGQGGAVKLDVQLTAALIEAQIIGDVRPTVAQPRSYTRTDAAMVAPFIDAVLNEFDDQLITNLERYDPIALRFGDRMEDARGLGLALEGHKFDLFVVTLDLADGAKTGVISVLMPMRTAFDAPDPPNRSARTGRIDSLEKNALEATATLEAVLTRIPMPLKDICNLQPGMVLEFPLSSLSEARLYAPRRHLVAEVRLGQMNGQRAVRLLTDDPPETDDPDQRRAQIVWPEAHVDLPQDLPPMPEGANDPITPHEHSPQINATDPPAFAQDSAAQLSPDH